MEVDNHDNLIGSARLIEAMLNVAEADINLLALRGRVAKSVLVDFKIADGLLADQVGPDNEVVQLVTAGSLVHDQLF
jgi:hypothetical protein